MALLGAAGIAASVSSIASCQFFYYRALDGVAWEDLTPPFDTLPQASVGLFSYSESLTSDKNPITGDSCEAYDEWQDVGQTAYWSLAQWASLVAPLTALLAVLQVSFELCGLCRLRGSYFLVPVLFFISFALQSCTFFLFMESQYW